MATACTSVESCLDALPEERRAVVTRMRDFVNGAIAEGYEERVGANGMIMWVVPHSPFPAGYHCNPKQPLMLAALSVNKAGYSLHMLSLYFDPAAMDALKAAFVKAGKKPDIGKGCIRFKKIEDLELDAVAEHMATMPASKFVERYTQLLGSRGK